MSDPFTAKLFRIVSIWRIHRPSHHHQDLVDATTTIRIWKEARGCSRVPPFSPVVWRCPESGVVVIFVAAAATLLCFDSLVVSICSVAWHIFLVQCCRPSLFFVVDHCSCIPDCVVTLLNCGGLHFFFGNQRHYLLYIFRAPLLRTCLIHVHSFFSGYCSKPFQTASLIFVVH